jgi:hypothetical protein
MVFLLVRVGVPVRRRYVDEMLVVSMNYLRTYTMTR